MTFKKIREYETKKGVVVSEYEHEKTGAIHLHTSVAGVENLFNIVFRTPVTNNMGIPHILEHMVLEGSKKYPEHNMFYKLSDKNFETEMNAGTYNNFTTYYFGSNLEEGYFNLADVYLDAVLNPLITEATFLQEGFRYDTNKNGELVFSGVVYNEMMAWVGKKHVQLDQVIAKEIFKNHPLSAVSGGDPISIADVTYQDILDFHKKCYNPSNSTTFTTGSIDITKIHQKLDSFFDKFERMEKVQMPPVVFENNGMKILKTTHAGDEIIGGIMTIKLGEDNYNEKVSDYAILSNLVYLANEKLCDYFTIEDKGILLDGAFVELNNGNLLLHTHFQMDSVELVNDVWKMWNFAWQKIVEEGIDEKIIESVLNNKIVEFDIEYEKGYASKLNIEQFYYYMQGDRFQKERSTKEYMIQLKEDLKNNSLMNTIINDKFLRKNNAVIAYSVENTNFVTDYNNMISEKEKVINTKYTEEEKQLLVNKIQILRSQEKEVKSNLPEIILDDKFSADKIIPKIKHNSEYKEVNGVNVKINKFNDEDVRARIHLSFPVVAETEEELIFESLQEQLFEHAAFKDMNREEANIWKKEGISDISYHMYIVDRKGKFVTQNIIVSGYKDKLDILAKKAIKIRTILDFTEKEEFKKTLRKLYLQTQEQSSHLLDKYTSILSLLNSSENIMDYLEYVKIIQKMREMLEGLDSGNDEVFQRFVAYYESNKRANSKANVVILDEDNGEVLDILIKNNVIGQGEDLPIEKLLDMVKEKLNNKIMLVADTTSAYAAYSVGGMPTTDNMEDLIKLNIAAYYLSDYSLETIRVKMGAYGAWARVRGTSMLFFSYRTPKPLESIDYYKGLVNNVINNPVSLSIFEAAKRKAFSDFIAYYSNRALARREENYWLKGEKLENVWRRNINLILSYTEKDMIAILEKYFNKNNTENICITTNKDFVDENSLLLQDYMKIEIPL